MNPKEGLKALARNSWVQRGFLVATVFSAGACARPSEQQRPPENIPGAQGTITAQQKQIEALQTAATQTKTLKPTPTEAPKPAPTAPAKPTTKEFIQENPIKLFPVTFAIADRTPGGESQEGWKWIILQLGAENNGRSPNSVNLTWDQLKKSKVLTKEGFEYAHNSSGNGFVFSSAPPLPPGFRMRGVYNGILMGGPILRHGMDFKVAKNTSGYKLQIPGFPDIDLEKEAEKIGTIRFPTNRPDSEFKEFGGSFVVPNKGTVTFLSIGREERIRRKGITSQMTEGLAIRARFDNANQGYQQDFSIGLTIIDDDGIFYPSSIGANVPPGLSKEGLATFPREINQGKLIASGDINEIFNLNLNSSDSRILRIAEYRGYGPQGMIFTVDLAEIINGKLKVRINIERLGSQRLILNKNKLYTFNNQQATQYKEGFKPGHEERSKLEALLREVNPKEFALRPTSNTEVSKTLNPGDDWFAWFETEDPLTLPPKDLAGFYLHLEPVTDRSASWDSYWDSYANRAGNHPLIEIIKP